MNKMHQHSNIIKIQIINFYIFYQYLIHVKQVLIQKKRMKNYTFEEEGSIPDYIDQFDTDNIDSKVILVLKKNQLLN